MKKSKLIRSCKINSLFVAVIGVAYCVMIFSSAITNNVGLEWSDSRIMMTYFGLVSGLSVVASGIVMMLLFGKIKKDYSLIIPIRILGFFVMINCISWKLLLDEGSFEWFAWIMLFGSMLAFSITLFVKEKLKFEQLEYEQEKAKQQGQSDNK